MLKKKPVSIVEKIVDASDIIDVTEKIVSKLYGKSLADLGYTTPASLYGIGDKFHIKVYITEKLHHAPGTYIHLLEYYIRKATQQGISAKLVVLNDSDFLSLRLPHEPKPPTRNFPIF